MPDTKATSELSSCFKTTSGGQVQLPKCRRCYRTAKGVSSMRVLSLRHPYTQFIATTPLELLHVDYTSIETMMELNKPPKIMNILVFQDHFTKHVMAYVTSDQTAKTVAKFLYQRCILIFGDLAKLFSNQAVNFMSSIIRELCKLMGIKKVRTLPYHAQTNGQVEYVHQSNIWMIGKLSKDEKAHWPNQLSEMVQAYNSTRSAVAGIAHIISCLDDD